jgi:cytochrome c oxidase subunit 3
MKFRAALLNLITSMAPIHWADQGIRRGDQNTLRWGLVAGIALAVVFLVLKVVEYSDSSYRWDSHPYGSIVRLIAGFSAMHVLALVLKTAVIAVLAWRGYFNQQRRQGVEVQGV